MLGKTANFLVAIFCTFLVFVFASPGNSPAIDTSEAAIYGEKTKASMTSLESKIRKSAVKVIALDGSGSGSGTYFNIEKKHVVLTAYHVVGKSERMFVMGSGSEIVIGDVVWADPNNDIAAIIIPELRSKTPSKFKPAEKDRDKYIGDNVFYSSFPSHHDLLSIRGRIIGTADDPRNSYIMNGYAWLGASGSGVFNEKGEYLGTLVAIDIGRWSGGVQLVETVIWVSPVSNIRVKQMKEHIKYYEPYIRLNE